MNAITTMAKRRDLTDEENIMAANLRRIWEEKKDALGIKTQEALMHELGFKSQAAVSQYLNGKIPLSLEATINFARVFQVDPGEINERLTLKNNGKIAVEISKQEDTVGETFRDANRGQFSAISIYANSLITRIIELVENDKISDESLSAVEKMINSFVE